MNALNESGSITIAAPASTIFAIVADPRQHPRIDGSGNVVGIVDGPDTLVLGSEFGMRMKMGAPYQMKNTVVEFEQDRLIAWRHVGAHRWRYQLAPNADGTTEVTETWDLSDYGAVGRRALHLLFGRKTARAIRTTLTNLKDAAESDAAGD